MVFQDPELFPWLTVRRNIEAGLVARGVLARKTPRGGRIHAPGRAWKHLPNAYPHHLSGGMAQRVALARALINHPKVLLLDEPLGALDAFTRMRMQDEVLRLWQARGTTMLLVTHDIDEAIYMSDRIVIMTPRPGSIERIILGRSGTSAASQQSGVSAVARRDSRTASLRRWRENEERQRKRSCCVSTCAMFGFGRRPIQKLDFIVAGAQKSGTTALNYYLKRHPQIALPIKKEVHFFDKDELFAGGNVSYEPLHEMFRPARSGTIGREHADLHLLAAISASHP